MLRKVSSMPGYSGGGGGLPPGVRGDGLSPGGLIIDGGIVGGPNGIYVLSTSGELDLGASSLIQLFGADGHAVFGNVDINADSSVRGVGEVDCANIFSSGDLSANNLVLNDDASTVRLLGEGLAPAVSHNGANATGTLLRATDLRGIVNLVLTSTGSAANAELCTVTFHAAYAAAPIIVVSALDDATATALPLGAFYVDQTTTPLTTFMLKCTSALAAGTYRCAYMVLG